MQVQLPKKDQYTTYDYEVGAQRMANVKEGKMSFVEDLAIKVHCFDCPGMPFLINSGDQLEWMAKNRHMVTFSVKKMGRDKLKVLCGREEQEEVNFIRREKTKEFAERTIKKWGAEYAEKVLSATSTGSLYWNVIHHFGSFANLLKEVRPKVKTVEKNEEVAITQAAGTKRDRPSQEDKDRDNKRFKTQVSTNFRPRLF